MSIDLDRIKARLARVRDRWPTEGVRAPGSDEFGPKAWVAHGPLRCHATEQGRARQWSQADADADFLAAAPGDIAALVAEIERLRSEVQELALTLANERGEGEPPVEGWTYDSVTGEWVHEAGRLWVQLSLGAWEYEWGRWDEEPTGTGYPTFRAAMRAASRGEHRREEGEK